MSVQTMAAVWRGSQHSGTALLMMLALADYADDKGHSFPSVSTLAEKTRMKPRNANYLLAALQQSGELLIKKGQGRNGTNLYRIVLERLQGVQSSAGVQRGAGVQAFAGLQRSAGGAATDCAKPLQPVADKPSMNHQDPSDALPSRKTFATKRGLACPYEQIVATYHEILTEMPRVKLLDAKGRRQRAEEFWKWVLSRTNSEGRRHAETSEQALDYIRRYFERARHNDFLMGRTERSGSHANWTADFDFIIGDRGRLQVIEKTEVAT